MFGNWWHQYFFSIICINFITVHCNHYMISETNNVFVQPDDRLVTVGMADGLLSMQRRKDDKQIASELEEKKHQKQAMKRRFKFDTQLYSYKASKVSFIFNTYYCLFSPIILISTLSRLR